MINPLFHLYPFFVSNFLGLSRFSRHFKGKSLMLGWIFGAPAFEPSVVPWVPWLWTSRIQSRRMAFFRRAKVVEGHRCATPPASSNVAFAVPRHGVSFFHVCPPAWGAISRLMSTLSTAGIGWKQHSGMLDDVSAQVSELQRVPPFLDGVDIVRLVTFPGTEGAPK